MYIFYYIASQHAPQLLMSHPLHASNKNIHVKK